MSKSQIDNTFFEKVIMYNALMDESYLASVLDHVEAKYFEDKNIRAIMEVVKDFYNKRSSIPTLTEIKSYLTTPQLKTHFKEVVNYFNSFDKKFNKDELYENTERFLKEKAVYNTLLDVVDDCDKGNVDTGVILNKFDSACGINLSIDTGLDYFNDIDTHIHDLTTQDDTIPSRWPWLDEKLGGGFLENGRALYVFAGETNVGKSIFLGNIACNIADQNKTVLLVSLEMSELVYAKRISTKITQIPIGNLHKRTDDLKAKIGYYKDSHAHTDSRILIKEFPPNTITCNHLKSFIKKLTDSGIVLDAIVVDYVNLLRSNEGNNSYERVKYATEQLRALSYIFSCPIITATQLNRSGFNEVNPGLDTIGESIGLAATADCIMSIWQEEEDAELGIIKLGMMKNRFGSNFGGITMRIDYSTLTLKEDETFDAGEELNTSASSLSFLSDDEFD
jgi:replicative DNA helicase